jgi:hypothetical protein
MACGIVVDGPFIIVSPSKEKKKKQLRGYSCAATFFWGASSMGQAIIDQPKKQRKRGVYGSA